MHLDYLFRTVEGAFARGTVYHYLHAHPWLYPLGALLVALVVVNRVREYLRTRRRRYRQAGSYTARGGHQERGEQWQGR